MNKKIAKQHRDYVRSVTAYDTERQITVGPLRILGLMLMTLGALVVIFGIFDDNLLLNIGVIPAIAAFLGGVLLWSISAMINLIFDIADYQLRSAFKERFQHFDTTKQAD
jgi:hypothetical protein